MHRELHGQPGFNGAGTQAALLPATAVCFAVLRAAGSFDLHGGSGRSVGNAVGESADRGEQASGGGGRTLARGAQIVSGGGAGAVHASGAARRWTASAGAGAGDCRGNSRAWEKSRARRTGKILATDFRGFSRMNSSLSCLTYR